MSLDVQARSRNWNRPCWTQSRPTAEPTPRHLEATMTSASMKLPGRAGRGGRAVLRRGRAPRLRAPGHPGDEHRRFRLAGGGYGNPFRGGGFEGLDRGVWFFNHCSSKPR